MHPNRFAKKSLGFFPTPIVSLARLSKKLGGPRILMKRDDQTGLAFGGNKIRKLEYLVGEAIAQGCDTLITGGAEQSNHCRQTAAAAAACGLSCHLVLGGEAMADPEGNLLLDTLLGAHFHWTGELRKGEKIPDITDMLKAQGARPYVVPYGGSNTTGALGFVSAVDELCGQLERLGETVTHVVFPSSSGGTQAGLMVGQKIYGLRSQLIGVGIDKDDAGEVPFREVVHRLALATAEKLGQNRPFRLSDILLREEYLGKGYGVVGEPEREAIRITAEAEGILLDPVYTGRAMAGLIDMVREKEMTKEDTVLFWHTGGTPALFSYGKDLVKG